MASCSAGRGDAPFLSGYDRGANDLDTRTSCQPCRLFVAIVRCLHFPPHHFDGPAGHYIALNRRLDPAVVIREKVRAASETLSIAASLSIPWPPYD